MAYRVTGSLVVHRRGADIVIDEERHSTCAEIGLQFVVSRLLERLSTHHGYGPSSTSEITILVWAEPAEGIEDAVAELAAQRIRDAERANVNPYLSK